jgi:hypothetical protein
MKDHTSLAWSLLRYANANKTRTRRKKRVSVRWNIFTGGKHTEVLDTLASERSEFFYVSVDLFLTSDATGSVTILIPVLDVDRLPDDLMARICHLGACNDHAWVEGVEASGMYNSVPVWNLVLGS